MSELIKDELLDYKFYIRSMSLMLQNSFGMVDRCKTYVDILKNIVDVGDGLFKRLNIFYYENGYDYCDLNNIDKTSTTDWYLDAIGEIFNLRRSFELPIYYEADVPYGPEIITLNNYEFLIYIQAMMMKYTFNGTYSDLLKLYNGSDILYFDKYQELANSDSSDITLDDLKYISQNTRFLPINSLKIKYKSAGYNDGNGSSLCTNVYLTGTVDFTNYPNIKKLFLAGYLTIESVGIIYNRSINQTFYRGKFTEIGSTPAADSMKFYSNSATNLGIFS